MPATRGYEPKFYEGDFSRETAALIWIGPPSRYEHLREDRSLLRKAAAHRERAKYESTSL